MPTTEARLPWALVLAGGDGKRLQELTCEIAGAPIPKQYCRLLGQQSLLQSTLARTQHLTPHGRTLVLINDNHRELAQGQVGMVPSGNLLVQPGNRDTGPGLLFGLLSLARVHPNSTVAVFPSDHFVDDEPAFVAHVEQAVRVVTLYPDKIALLGIQPDRPTPGFGYLVPARPLGISGASHVAGFWEKPSAEMAGELVVRNGLWNSFVMVFQLSRMLSLLQRLVPQEIDLMREALGNPQVLARHYST